MFGRETKRMNNWITELAIVTITVTAILVFGVEAKDIAIAAIAGLTGYLTRGNFDDKRAGKLIRKNVSTILTKKEKPEGEKSD